MSNQVLSELVQKVVDALVVSNIVVFTLPNADQTFRPIPITDTTKFAVDEDADGVVYIAKHIQTSEVQVVAEHRNGEQVPLRIWLKGNRLHVVKGDNLYDYAQAVDPAFRGNFGAALIEELKNT